MGLFEVKEKKNDHASSEEKEEELSKSDYFTITSKYHHSGDKYILKDSAGREVDRVTKKEYKEKYGDVLQRGTKKYGKEMLSTAEENNIIRMPMTFNKILLTSYMRLMPLYIISFIIHI